MWRSVLPGIVDAQSALVNRLCATVRILEENSVADFVVAIFKYVDTVYTREGGGGEDGTFEVWTLLL